MKPVLVYLSGPITAAHGYSLERNIADAADVFIACIQAHIPAFCPHLGALLPTAHSAVPYGDWMAYDFAILDRCTHVLMLDRWQTSSGAKREHDYAFMKALPIFYTLDSLVAALDA